jgi:hypothetical protein
MNYDLAHKGPFYKKSHYDKSISHESEDHVPHILHVDSSFRNLELYPNNNKFGISVNYQNIISMELIELRIKPSNFNITNENNLFTYVENLLTSKFFVITPGKYTKIELLNEIENGLNANADVGVSYQVVYFPYTDKFKVLQITGNIPFTFTFYNNLPNKGEKHEPVYYTYKENSIAKVLGFLPKNYSSNSSYEIYSDFPIKIENKEPIFLVINEKQDFKNVHTNNHNIHNAFCVLYDTDYEYSKTLEVNNRFIKIFNEPIRINELIFEFKNSKNNYVDFENNDIYMSFELKWKV